MRQLCQEHAAEQLDLSSPLAGGPESDFQSLFC